MNDRPAPPALAERPPRRHRMAVVAIGSGSGFVVLAVLSHQVAFFPLDLAITRAVQGLHAPGLDAVLAALNRLGFPPLVEIIYGAILLVIFAAGRRREAVATGFAAVGAIGLNIMTKTLVARPRPDADLVLVEHHIHNGSFPAGHVLNLTAFAGLLGYLVAVRAAPSWHRTASVALIVLLIAMMGLARIHSGEHWPSDVLGAYLLAFVWLAASIRFYQRIGPKPAARLAPLTSRVLGLEE